MGKRITFSILIILIGVGVSFVVVDANNPSKNEEVKILKPNKEENSLFEYKTNKPELRSTKDASVSKNANLTNAVADLISAKIAQENPQGPQQIPGADTKGLEVPSLEDMGIEKERVEKIEEKVLSINKFTPQDLKIIERSSENQKKKYLTQIAELTKKNFGETPHLYVMTNALIHNGDSSLLMGYNASISTHINDLLTINVPADFTKFHINSLNLWKKKQKIVRAILNTSQDPLKGWAAFQKIPELIDQTQQLNNDLREIYKSMNQ